MPLTLRELCWMAEGRSREEWSHTSHLLWMQAESNRDRKQRAKPFRPSDFDPHRFSRQKQEPIVRVTMAEAKAIFHRDRD